MPAGRPSEFKQEIVDIICERIATGQSLRSICLTDDMPSNPTVCKWLAENETFLKQYARAREIQADKIFDEILDIADSQEGDVYIKDGVEFVNHDAIQRAKLRVDARKWMAGKLRPRVYGDKIAIGGADDLPPVSITTLDTSKLSDAALAEFMALFNATDTRTPNSD